MKKKDNFFIPDNYNKMYDINDENYDTLMAINETKHIKNPSFTDIENIVNNHSAAVFVWGNRETFVDSFTASGLIAVYQGLGPEMQAKFNRMVGASLIQFMKVVNFMWAHVS